MSRRSRFLLHCLGFEPDRHAHGKSEQIEKKWALLAAERAATPLMYAELSLLVAAVSTSVPSAAASADLGMLTSYVMPVLASARPPAPHLVPVVSLVRRAGAVLQEGLGGGLVFFVSFGC